MNLNRPSVMLRNEPNPTAPAEPGQSGLPPAGLSLDEARASLPEFERRPFELPGSRVNPGLDVIVRARGEQEALPTPVGVVSKAYHLLQHRAVLDMAQGAIANLGIGPDELKAGVALSPLGEQMVLALHFPGRYRFDPGDGHEVGLQLICMNSVDRSMRFRALLGWYRFVCSNGLVLGRELESVDRIHNAFMDVARMGAFIGQRLEHIDTHIDLCRSWFQRRVSPQALGRWVDGPLRKRWGVHAAARAYHISRTGRDAELAVPFESGPPSGKTVNLLGRVPGAHAPAGNAYAVSQALSWLATRRKDPGERADWMAAIPRLIGELIAPN